MGFNADFVSGKDVQMDQDSVMGIITQNPESTQSSLNWTVAGEKLYGVPFVIEAKPSASATPTVIFNANAPFPFIVIDAWCAEAQNNTGDTWKIDNGTADIVAAVSNSATDTAITRAATLNDANYKIAKDGTLRIVTTGDPVCNVFILCMRVPN